MKPNNDKKDKKNSPLPDPVEPNASPVPGVAAPQDVTLSQAYLDKLEVQIQKALESSVKFASEEIKKELQVAVNDIATQNHNLVEALKGFEGKLIESFQSLAGKLYDGLSQNFNQTVTSIQEQNKELVSTIDKLEDDVRDRFQGLLAQSLNSVGSQLSSIAEGFKVETQKAVNEEIQKELEDFSESMRTAQQQTVQSLANMYKEVEGKKAEMEQTALKEAGEYKEKLISDIDKRLGDIITGFLIENLGESLDISQQRDYIFEVLEEHKEELKKDLHA